MTRKRLDVTALHSALDFVRAHRRMAWKAVADETGVSASTFTRLGQGHAPDADGTPNDEGDWGGVLFMTGLGIWPMMLGLALLRRGDQ